MKEYLPLDYLCIDIANHFGLDKLLFEDRIAWVKDNYAQLEQLADKADVKPLYMKAVHELRNVVAGKPTGHIVQLDATCSGIQLLSAMSGCVRGADATGLVSHKRADAYTDVTREMNKILQLRGMSTIVVPRADVKRAMMTSVYGSTAVPKEVFGEGDLLDVFYSAVAVVAPAAFELMTALLHTWQPYALQHSWVMPDNHHVMIKVLEQKETRIEVDELNHATFTTYVTINQGTEKGVANVANVTHSVDAYVLRSVIRRASYDVKKVKEAYQLLNSSLSIDADATEPCDDALQTMLDIYKYSAMLDISIIDYINESNVHHVPLPMVIRLLAVLTEMLARGSSPVVTVHDSFGSLPTHCNTVRYWYKEICGELADSEMLSFLVSQITGKRVKYVKKSNNLGDKIRKSSYGIC